MSGGFAFDFGTPLESAAVETVAPQTQSSVLHLPFISYDLPSLISTTPSVVDIPTIGDIVFLATNVTGQSLRVIHHRRAPRVDSLEMGESDGDRRDIVQGSYLGGLKVWSCAPDVAQEVYSGNVFRSYLKSNRRKLRVAELGCGQALPSIAAIMCMQEEAASGIVFSHDYNYEVIRECTLPNMRKNFSEGTFTAPLKVSVGAGEWDALTVADFGDSVDVIVGADVTFDDAATKKVLLCIDRLLGQRSIAIIGTKHYYFGTGGGLGEMEQVIKAHNLPLCLRVLWEGGEGSMRRAVVVLSRPVVI